MRGKLSDLRTKFQTIVILVSLTFGFTWDYWIQLISFDYKTIEVLRALSNQGSMSTKQLGASIASDFLAIGLKAVQLDRLSITSTIQGFLEG